MQDLLKPLQQAVWTATDWVRQNPEAALLTAVGLHLVFLLGLVALWVRTARLMKRQQTLLSGANGQSIEKMLLEQVSRTEAVRQQIDSALQSSQKNTDSQKRSFQRLGLVRFDAYTDVGGEQSFALALLDDSGSGFVLTGLHSRNDMRVYAKAVTRGVSALTLSDEEQRAIASAHSPDASALEPQKGSLRPRRAQPQS